MPTFQRFSSLLLALVMVVSSIGCASVSEHSTSLVGKPVPEARLMLATGEQVALRSKSGTIVVLLFWATWCSHSRAIMADFEDLAREYAGRGDIEFFAISLDKNDDFELVEARIKAQDLSTMTHVFSGNDTQDESYLALKGDHVPYAVVIDARGVVRFVDIGISGLESFLAKKLSKPRQ
jgi:thiol-disulfide isomerase/thioredoxin